MRLKPSGIYVRIRVDEIQKTSSGGIILTDTRREQEGYNVGVLEAIGPLAFTGLKGIDDNLPPTERARLYGVEIGQSVEFNRHAGREPRREEDSDGLFRIIQDQHIIGRYVPGDGRDGEEHD